MIVISGALAYDAFTSYMKPYMTVSQVVQNSSEYREEKIQIIGIVANGSVTYENATIVFNLTDEESAIKINFVGSPPQNFQEGVQVVVIGSLVSSNTLEADEMLVKCPSKYEGEGEGDSLLTNPIFLIAVFLGVGAIAGMVASLALKKKSIKKMIQIEAVGV